MRNHLKLRAVEKCIYCGATDSLSKEHIVPYGFNGTRALLRASCPDCASITSSFEREILRVTWGAVRAILNIKSRRKKNRHTLLPMKMERNGEAFIQDVPIDDYIPLLPVLYVGLPGYLRDGRRYQVGDGSRNATIVGKAVIKSDAHVDELLKRYNATKINIEYSISPVDFGRLLAKIAYCLAVDTFGLDGIVDTYVLPAILGQSNDIWHFVGCDYQYPYVNHVPQKRDAFIWVDLDIIKGDILVRLRLLPQSDSPVYVIVVGRASDGLQGLFQSIGRQLS